MSCTLYCLCFGHCCRTICCSCVCKPTRPTWNKIFDMLVSMVREAVQLQPDISKDKNAIEKLRKSMDKPSSPPSDVSKVVKVTIEEQTEIELSYEWVYPITESKPVFPILNSESKRKFVLFLHGGSFALQTAASYRAFTSKLSMETNTTVLTINYRRAPEYPHPAGEIDCFKAYKWLVNKVNPANIIIIGDSAGGALVVSALVRARDAGIPMPKGAVLISPWVDIFNTTHESFTKYETIDYLNRNFVSQFANVYIHPPMNSYSATHQSLIGFPSLLVEYGECEVLSGQIKDFIDKAKTQGLSVTFHEYPDMVHCFPMFYMTKQPQSQESFRNIDSFIKTLQ